MTLPDSLKHIPEEPSWEDLIPCLTVFAKAFAQDKPWFRGKKTSVYLMGKEIKDYVFEAIGRYLENPEKHDSDKGCLLDYLKYNLLRSLLSNDLRKKENELTEDLSSELLDADDEDSESSYLERIMPFTEALFDDDIDYKEIISQIELEISGDKVVEDIFLGLTGYGLKRSEIIQEFEMSNVEFDNGMKRLKTVKNRIALNNGIKQLTK